MAEEIKAKVVETEEKSIQEKEEVVQKNSGFDKESQMYKVDLSKPPKQKTDVDYHVAEWFNDTHVQLIPVVERFMKKQNTTPVGYMAWRLENDNV